MSEIMPQQTCSGQNQVRPTGTTRQQAPALPWLATVLAVIAATLLSSFIVAFAFDIGRAIYLSGQHGTKSSELFLIFRAGTSQLVATIALATIVRISGYRFAKYFGFVLPRKRDAIIAIAATSLVLFLEYLVGLGSKGPAILPSQVEAYQSAQAAGVPVIFLAVIILIIPLGEELIYRGFLFRGLEYSRIGSTGAVFVTTLFWWIQHVPNHALYLLFIAVLGLLFGWVRMRSGSTLLTWILHGAVNLAAMIAIAY